MLFNCFVSKMFFKICFSKTESIKKALTNIELEFVCRYLFQCRFNNILSKHPQDNCKMGQSEFFSFFLYLFFLFMYNAYISIGNCILFFYSIVWQQQQQQQKRSHWCTNWNHFSTFCTHSCFMFWVFFWFKCFFFGVVFMLACC